MGKFLLRQTKLFLGIAALCAPLCALIYFISKEYFDEILVGIFVLYAVLLAIFIFKFIIKIITAECSQIKRGKKQKNAGKVHS